MKLDAEFIRLPLTFDVQRLLLELSAFEESDWQPHPGALPGNSALHLVAARGEVSDEVAAPMLATRFLKSSPYVCQIMATLRSVFGRSRFMRLDPHCEVPQHVDFNAHWRNRVRLHIPVVTDPNVIFHCADKRVNMAAGECWIFDSWQPHRVTNDSHVRRVHLVLDTSGSSFFWNLVGGSERPCQPNDTRQPPTQLIPYQPGVAAHVLTELHGTPPVMNPGEVDGLCESIILDISSDASEASQLINTMRNFCWDWRQLWYLHGPSREGWPAYDNLIKQTTAILRRSKFPVQLMSNNTSAALVFHSHVLSMALDTDQSDSAA